MKVIDFIKKKNDLIQNKDSNFCAPLTSFDWNETDPHIIGTGSIDTTCTIWDIEVFFFTSLNFFFFKNS